MKKRGCVIKHPCPRLYHARLVEMLMYEAETGHFFWIKEPCKIPCKRLLGKRAGSKTNKGYRIILIDGEVHLEHRLAWLYVHQRFPPAEIDHINGIRDDNRICNLREARRFENRQNLENRPARPSRSGMLGAHAGRDDGEWKSAIHIRGERKDLGEFSTKEDAHNAYLEAKKTYHRFNPVPREAK